MKKFLAFILTLAMLLCPLAVQADSERAEDSIADETNDVTSITPITTPRIAPIRTPHIDPIVIPDIQIPMNPSGLGQQTSDSGFSADWCDRLWQLDTLAFRTPEENSVFSIDAAMSLNGSAAYGSELTLASDGTLQSDIDLNGLLEAVPELPFSIPELNLSASDGYEAEESGISLLPGHTPLALEYEESGGQLFLTYSNIVEIQGRTLESGLTTSGGEVRMEITMGFVPKDAQDSGEATVSQDAPEELFGSWKLVRLEAECDQVSHIHSLDVSKSLHLHDGVGTHLTFEANGAMDTDIDVPSLIEESPAMPFDIPPLSISGDRWRFEDGQIALSSGDTYALSFEDGSLVLTWSGRTLAHESEKYPGFSEGEADLEVVLGFERIADDGQAPEPTEEPTPEPTEEPTPEPTEEPTPEPTEEPTPEPTEEPTPEPTEEPTPEPTEEPEAGASVDDVLDALGNPTWRNTYNALLAGEIVQKGSKGETARGVQQTLIAFGQDIAADGNVGPKTIGALNAVQAAFGLAQTQIVDAAGYAELLPRLLVSTNEDAAYDLLAYELGDEFYYMQGCAYVAQGKYYSAKQAFEYSGYGDWEFRAASCVQPWPKTGQLYKNPDVQGSSTELSVQYNGDFDTAMLVKIYTVNGVLARTMFIAGTGKATVSLPAGYYIIKDGTGKTWYGEEEAFGDEGNYEIMTFSDGSQQVELKRNYSSTITVNVQEYNPSADSVGSDYENWRDF